MSHNESKIRLVVSAFIAVGLLTLLFFYTKSISGENAETAKLITSSGQMEEAERAAQLVRSIRASSGADIASFESLVLTSERLVPFIESIESAGRALGVDLEIASVDKKDEGEGSALERIRMVVKASGSWSGTYSLLKAIESLPYRVMIENVSLTKNDSAWEEAITLSLNAFK